MKTKRHNATKRQNLVIGDLVRAHCSRVGDYAVYADGWDEQRILAEVNANNPDPDKVIHMASVQSMRKDLFGNVRKAREEKTMSVSQLLVQRVKDLENDVDRIELRLSKIDGHLTAFVERLNEQHKTIVEVIAWMEQLAKVRGYAPPPGRPQSTPPGLFDNA
jgi:hypothetical protein